LIGSGDVTNNVTITVNDFRRLPIGIVPALAPFPEARQAVLKVLGGDVDAVPADRPMIEGGSG
jgi:hypothetical protein